jgi:hypothetical protein
MQCMEYFTQRPAASVNRNISNVANRLLTVSSCKNHKKYFAIKSIISLFRPSIMQASNSISSLTSFSFSKGTIACSIITSTATITIITG